MIIFKAIEIRKFRNIKHVKLEGLKDLNILIGPNNCGKTNILEAISKINAISLAGYHFACTDCDNNKGLIPDVINLSYSLAREDFYLGDPNNEMIFSFLLNDKQINELVPSVLEKQRERLEQVRSKQQLCKFIGDDVIIKSVKGSTTSLGYHISPFLHEDILEEIKNSILYCPEGRLQSYKGKEFRDYIRERKLRGAEKRRWIDFLSKIVDPKIDDERYENLIRKVDGEDFETEISKQGSGVRSLVCLAVDILFNPAKRVVLIDEPELGLNPFVKQEFLKFLLKEAEGRQIFVATQDPTFVNPILWKNDKVSVYFYSVLDEELLKIDLKQNQEDPEVFAGYLPHTVSLKDTHIYVEGTSDVYIFQIWLEKYLKKFFPENWYEFLNKVGIYHLCGSFWKHLLYTIPKHPYKCLVILDGDKREEAEKVCKRYNESKVNTSRFEFCRTIEDVAYTFGGEHHPIYCVKEKCIEKYLMPEFDCTKIPKNYDKKRDGPQKAEELQEIPEEIIDVLAVIFGKPKRVVVVKDESRVANSLTCTRVSTEKPNPN